MRRIAAALMLAASTSAQAQTYDPVEILPTDIPAIPASSVNPPIPTNLGDDATKQVDLGFTFNYFGQDFTKAWISSNGFVSFESGANLCCNGRPLEQAQRNTIYEYWTDLINWTGTPYYSKQKSDDGVSSLLVGWYGTYEYGGNKQTSFEMYLYETGAITFNYIKTYDLQGHTVTAGLTGPTSEDNILLYYGNKTSSLSGKAYSFNYQTGTVTVDCSISPLDPSCPPINIPGGAPSVTPEISPTTTEIVSNIVPQNEQLPAPDSSPPPADTSREQLVTIEQDRDQAIAQVTEQQPPSQEQNTVQAPATSNSTSTREAAPATKSVDRLNPSQLAALNSGGSNSLSPDIQQSSGQSLDSQQSGEASSKSSLQLFTNASNASIAMAEAEQQQQLQSSIDSSVSPSQMQAQVETSLIEAAQPVVEMAISSSEDIKTSSSLLVTTTNEEAKTNSVPQLSNNNEIKVEYNIQPITSEVKQDSALFQIAIPTSEDTKTDYSIKMTTADIKQDNTSSQVALTNSEEETRPVLVANPLESSTINAKTDNINYQDQQKSINSSDNLVNRDSSTFMQQILQPEQVIVADNSQQSTIVTQQNEEDKSLTTPTVTTESTQSSIASAEGRWQESISSQSATLEALNSISNQSNSGDTQESPSSLGDGQGEVMAQIAYVPGFSAYKLVTLPDRPDFYKPRRIYKNNRPVDAYMSIFKMTAANDSLWKQMVESQYE